jgi:hypothetical protein
MEVLVVVFLFIVYLLLRDVNSSPPVVYRCDKHEWSYDSADRLRCTVCNYCPKLDDQEEEQ